MKRQDKAMVQHRVRCLWDIGTTKEDSRENGMKTACSAILRVSSYNYETSGGVILKCPCSLPNLLDLFPSPLHYYLHRWLRLGVYSILLLFCAFNFLAESFGSLPFFFFSFVAHFSVYEHFHRLLGFSWRFIRPNHDPR